MRRFGGLALAVGLAASVFTVTPAQAAPQPTAAVADAAPAAFTPVSPVRVLDTRSGLGATGPVGAAQTITLNLSANVPASTTAVVPNVTGTTPALGPVDTPKPVSYSNAPLRLRAPAGATAIAGGFLTGFALVP